VATIGFLSLPQSTLPPTSTLDWLAFSGCSHTHGAVYKYLTCGPPPSPTEGNGLLKNSPTDFPFPLSNITGFPLASGLACSLGSYTPPDSKPRVDDGLARPKK